MGEIADWLLERAMEEHLMDGGFDYDDCEDEEPSEDIEYTCLECGAKGVIKTNSKTGEKFVGCSSFPACRNSNYFTEKPIPKIDTRINHHRKED